MGVASWIVVGALVGCVVGRLTSARLPGGLWADAAAGVAGGFIGGGLVALVNGGDVATIQVLELAVVVLCATLLVLCIRRAAQVQPRTRA